MNEMMIDCYNVNADFAGLWHHEDMQDLISVKLRMGLVFIFAGCLLLWVSKMQMEIVLSTTEAEYIALSQSMHD